MKIDINTNNDNVNKMVVYLQHHSVFNISKPGKAYIVFDVGAKCQSASFNINLFKGHDL